MTDDPWADRQELVRDANIAYFRAKPYITAQWRGVRIAKCPMDLWVYQELIHTLEIDLLVETGTFHGGSALFFADMLDRGGRGQVISIDKKLRPDLPDHPRLCFLQGRSTDADIRNQVGEAADKASNVMVVLDSDHRHLYKLFEMTLYAPFVTFGSYLIAEDSAFDHYPAWPEYGPGPAAAVRDFIAHRDDFVIDRACERHMISFAPKAFLKRIADQD